MPVRDETEEILQAPGSVLIPVRWVGAMERKSDRFKLRFTFQGCTDGDKGLCYPPDTYVIGGRFTSQDGKLLLREIRSQRLDPFAPLPKPEESEGVTEPSTPRKAGGVGSVGNGNRTAIPADRDSENTEAEAVAAPVTARIERNLGFTGNFKDIVEKSLLLSFAVAFLGGLLTSLTPCVYPMIPATVAIFTGAEVSSRLQSVSLAATYIMGVALSYAALGVSAAALGTVFGTAMENP